MEKIAQLYFEYKGFHAKKIEQLAGAGSNRCYYRCYDKQGESLIAVEGTSVEENESFIYLASHFNALHLPMPSVLAVSSDRLCYLQTDLGSVSLFDALKEGRNNEGNYNESEIALLENIIKQLPLIQIKGAENLDWNRCYPQPEFDKENVMFDLNYFKYCFLKLTNIDFNEFKLQHEFYTLADHLTQLTGNYFMYRDFQARNVMLTQDSEPCFIDFQGGRKGPFYYDLASFLWQASAQYNDELRAHLIEVYYQELKKWVAIGSLEKFKSNLNLFVLFRTLQVLGAYGFRGYIEEKSYFVRSIPFAINNLKALLQHKDLFKPYAYLKEVLEKLVSLPQFENKSKADTTASSCKAIESQELSNNKKLKVLVYSFSYHRGIPKDLSGNGGGYVFDCRAVHNPGRYAQYKKLMGRDPEVIQFLEDDGEITEFLSHVYGLVDMHVARYIERGFTNLMFSFGCTGGQHRSVYSAQHVAEYISNKFGCEVQLIHREQHIEEHYEAK